MQLIVGHAESVGAQNCVLINSIDTNNAFYKLQHRFYDQNHGILRGFRDKNVSKTAEFVRKFWAEVETYVESDLVIPSERKAAYKRQGWLAMAYNQAKSYKMNKEGYQAQMAKAKSKRDKKRAQLEAMEKHLHVGVPLGACDVERESKKACHSTGLTRSGPRDAASVNLKSLNQDDSDDKDPLGQPPKDFDDEMMKSFETLQQGTKEFMEELKRSQGEMKKAYDQAEITNLIRLRDDPQTPQELKERFKQKILEIMNSMAE